MSRAILAPEVLDHWIRHTERYEGRIPWMYLDIRGLVTIGAGVLVDPVELALRLPLQLDGRQASPSEIADEWRALKARPSLAQQGAGAAGRVARLRLTGADLDALTWARLDSTVRALVRRWPGLPGWPWQAQLAVCSWAWAVGAAAQGWPRFEAALHAQDWTTAAEQCRIRDEDNPGVTPRNAENRRLFLEAAAGATTVPPPEDRPSSPPVVIVDDEAPATDRLPVGEVAALVAETGDQLARELLAEGYRRR
jgi:GH24 family phage-related lysozyme (muramidase)